MTGRNRVVFVSQRFPPDKGGNAARIHDVATNMGDRWDVTVLAPPPSYPPGEFERTLTRHRTDTVDGVSVHRLWTWQPQVEDPGTLRRLAYYLLFGLHAATWLVLNGRRYDAVVTTTPPISTGAPGLLAAVLGTPLVVDVRDRWIDASISLGYLEEGSLLERVSRRFQRYVLHAADRISVTTTTLGESLRETYGDSLEGKIVHVPNGVDTDRFRPTDAAETEPADPTADLPPAATDGGTPTIVYAGNLGSAQDLESCVRAMASLPRGAAVLKLVGRGDAESDLRDLVDETGVGDRVEFVGTVPREDVPGILADAAIGVAPLRDAEDFAYAMPTKVYEYMATGLPAVVTGRGEIERFVETSGGGLHVSNDPERIADRFAALLDDDRRRRRLGENGREHVVEHCDRAAIARRFGAELTHLVEAGS